MASGFADDEFASELLSSGISGLNDVLAGGLPAGHLYLIDGDPGTGKTTLGIQFLLEGVSQQQPGLYITLSESEKELRQVARSHGWNLSGIDIFELLPMEDSLKAEEQYTILYPGEVELPATIKAILKRIEESDPKRIVFDSLSELRLLAREPLRFRRQLLALRQYFANRECTVLLLDDHTGGADERDLQSIVHGVIRLENLPRDYGTKRRRLEIVKLRGVQVREGYHDYNIRTGGLEVYPRLVATEHKRSFSSGLAVSGLQELDALLGGGLNRGTSTLLMGPAGAGKSTIALRYAATAAERGEYAYFVTFDEGLPTLLERAEGLSIPVPKLLESGRLQIEIVDPVELSPGHFVSRVRAEVQNNHASLVVIDSLNGLLAAMPGEHYLTIQLHELLAFLSNQGTTTILVMAQYGILGQSVASPVDVSYLADSIMLLRYFEAMGEVRQAISVVKKRSGKHERTIRELQLGPDTIRVGRPLTEFQGVLSGVPSYVGKRGPLMQGTDDESKS
ncbi:MAG TPA: ATPase domain-containing protein [Bryobacteraceae bacterium]|nr:ATPase domain-containing protein [Bryobacteraceae bacterium]